MAIGNYIPVVSMFKVINETSRKGQESFHNKMRLLGHLTYALVSAGSLALYTTRLGFTGELNPLKQPEALVQYREAREKLFGANGLADTNHDGTISAIERIEAYQKMGLDAEISFPKCRLEDLVKGIEAYKK